MPQEGNIEIEAAAAIGCTLGVAFKTYGRMDLHEAERQQRNAPLIFKTVIDRFSAIQILVEIVAADGD